METIKALEIVQKLLDEYKEHYEQLNKIYGGVTALHDGISTFLDSRKNLVEALSIVLDRANKETYGTDFNSYSKWITESF